MVYVDSSVLARSYLSDEPEHEHAVALLEDPETGRVTGTWTPIEVSAALVRAARSGRGDRDGLLAQLDADLSDDGRVNVLSVPQADVEAGALSLVREYAIRAMDAWHLATAALMLPALTEPGEEAGFASRDKAQSAVAQTMGFRLV